MAQNLKRSAKNQQINDNKIKVEEKIDCFLCLVEAGKKRKTLKKVESQWRLEPGLRTDQTPVIDWHC